MSGVVIVNDSKDFVSDIKPHSSGLKPIANYKRAIIIRQVYFQYFLTVGFLHLPRKHMVQVTA